jgi:thioredoxin 1
MSSDPEDVRERIRAQKRAELREQHAEAPDGDASPGDPVPVDGRDDLDGVVVDHDPVLVDFYADWCGPCQMLEPTLETIAAETPATVATVDIDANQRLARSFGVRGVPTLVLFAGGEEVERLTGARGEVELRSLVERHA